MHLEGRVAVITGATGGLGRVVARTLAENGASLALLSSDQSKLDAVAQDLPDERVLTHAADLRTCLLGDRVRRLAQRVGAPPAHDHMCALASERARRRPANTLAGARDHRDLAAQAEIHLSPPAAGGRR